MELGLHCRSGFVNQLEMGGWGGRGEREKADQSGLPLTVWIILGQVAPALLASVSSSVKTKIITPVLPSWQGS